MTTTLKLKKKKPVAVEKRAPARGATAPRRRPTLAEAQAERARPRRDNERNVPQDARPRLGNERNVPDALPRPSNERSPTDNRPRRSNQQSARDDMRPRRSSQQSDDPRPRRSNQQSAPHDPRPRRGTLDTQPQPASAPPAVSLEGERLSKRMAALGLASRRESDEWIEAGWVRVNGKVAVLGQRVRPEVHIEIDPTASRQQAARVTILLNKPIGYVSGQPEDGHEPAVLLITPGNHWSGDHTNLRFSAAHLRHLAPAGRLDIDSTGLLVLTQDGRIAKQLVGEDSPLEKEYLVRVRCADPALAAQGLPSQVLPPECIQRLREGLWLDGAALKPAKVSWQNEERLRFALREGKKRQIRRMCELVGLQVIDLERLRIGRISLGALPPGKWRYLSPFERF